PAIQAERCFDGHHEGDAIENWQSARQPETNRTSIAIWGISEVRGARAEQLRLRKQLGVALQSNDGLVGVNHSYERIMNLTYFARGLDSRGNEGGCTTQCHSGI